MHGYDLTGVGHLARVCCAAVLPLATPATCASALLRRLTAGATVCVHVAQDAGLGWRLRNFNKAIHTI